MRISTASTYRRVLLGIRQNQLSLIRAQEQISSGRRILRPSDDPTGAARAIRLEQQLSEVERYRDASRAGRRALHVASQAMSEVSRLMTDARELLVQGMNGTLSQNDRESIAVELGVIRDQLLELGNQQAGDQYVFGGAQTTQAPWEEVTAHGRTRVAYRGDESTTSLRIGASVSMGVTLPGLQAFGRFEPSGTSFNGPTGAAAGATANEGTGFAYLRFRHDGTDPGTLGSVGLGLVEGGAQDTVLGSNALTIDAAAGTIRLGSGEAIALPETPVADFVVTNELGGELHLDFTGYTGADYSDQVTAAGSVSLDGTSYTAIDFTETDLELVDEAAGTVVHVNTTAVRRSGNEQIEFVGATNVFDMMQTLSDEMRNVDGLSAEKQLDRLEKRLVDLDRHHQNTLSSAGVLGSRSARLQASDERSTDVELQLQGLIGEVTDADLAEVATDLTRSEYLLQIAQASGARLLQTSLLNYLG